MSELELNKRLVFDWMQENKVAMLTISYAGYGDSGQIEQVWPTDAEGQAMTNLDMSAPSPVLMEQHGWEDGKIIKRYETGTWDEALEDLAWDLLRERHPGWEINEGSDGQFEFTLHGHRLLHVHNSHYTQTNTTEVAL